MECRGRRVIFRVEERVLPNGYRMRVDKVIFPDAVAVLPVFSDGKVILIRQYRPVLDKYILEAPAGVIGEGETPEEAAVRELEEETGLRATRLVKVGAAHTSPGYSTEKLHLYLAPDPQKGEMRPEEHEIIRLETYTLEELPGLIREGKIEDLKTVALILAALQWRGGSCEAEDRPRLQHRGPSGERGRP